MSLDQNGIYRRSERPNQPVGWKTTRAAILHHMIDWSALRGLWNAMVTHRLADPLSRYLEIIRYGTPRDRRQLVQRIRDGAPLQVDLMARDTLAECICWQRYNLFEGPPADFRQPHSPDPARMLQHFATRGATSFDFPIVAPPHGQRAHTLWRAFGGLASFCDADSASRNAPRDLDQTLDLLASVQHLDVIPGYEVNWFRLPKDVFWRMPRSRRRAFFETCLQRGWGTNGEEVYRELFGDA